MKATWTHNLEGRIQQQDQRVVHTKTDKYGK